MKLSKVRIEQIALASMVDACGRRIDAKSPEAAAFWTRIEGLWAKIYVGKDRRACLAALKAIKKPAFI